MKTLRYLLFSVFCLTFMASNAQSLDEVKVAISEINAGTSWNVDVAFENAASGNYTAFQMDLSLPEGFVYEENSLKTDTRLLGHTCSAHMGADGILHVMAYAANNMEIPGNTGKLFSLTIGVKAGTAEGLYRIVPGNVRFAKRDGNEFLLDANTVDFMYKAPVVVKDYSVIYMVDGKEYQRQTVTQGQNIPVVETPVKEGYTFTGWKNLPSLMPDHDVTVEAVFTVNKYKLVAKVDGKEYKTVEVEFGAKIVLPEAPVKEGYTFGGWSEAPATMPAHDVEISGTFTVNKYKVVLKIDGEIYQTLEVAYGAKIVLPEVPEVGGKQFSGWSEVPATMPAHDIEVTGSYQSETHQLIFKIGDEIYQQTAVACGDSIVLPVTPVREGYVFSGWGKVESVMPAHDLTYTGRFILSGDLNEDGIVDVTDITAIVNIILRVNSEISEMEKTVADVNGDGVIDVTDISGVVNIILHQ